MFDRMVVALQPQTHVEGEEVMRTLRAGNMGQRKPCHTLRKVVAYDHYLCHPSSVNQWEVR